MSYEKGDKFILEIAEVFKGEDKTLYRAKNFKSFFDENSLQRFRRIRETAEEAYKRGYEDGKSEVDKARVEHHVVEPSEEQLSKARAEGAEEAWEFMKAIDCSPSEEYSWYMQAPKGYYEMSYTEAKADFERWKADHKWEPKVGDAVVSCYGEKGILLEIIGDNAYVMWKHEGCGYCEVADLTPTGKHIDISPIFEAMK